MIAWMLYSLVVGLLAAVAARSAETLARLRGYRLRWIWIGALALTVALELLSAIARLRTPVELSDVATATLRTEAARTPTTWPQVVRAFVERVGQAIDASIAQIAQVVGTVDRSVSSAASLSAMLGWLALSVMLATILATVWWRVHRARREWPVGRVQDVIVRVAPHVGPFVVGVMRPEIVVPRWLLARADDEQRLAVAHEQEHLRARDPVLLTAAWLVVVMTPWNLACWYMLSRLRLAIELDCDARVVRRGAAPAVYGSLLIDVAQHASPLTLSALGLAGESSQLYQRILALRGRVAPFARTRSVVAALFAASGVLAACRISPPRASTPTSPLASLSEARAAGSSDSTSAADGEPLFLIDGVRSTHAALLRLDKKQIAAVEVVKGIAAQTQHGDDARYGVVIVRTTKTTTTPP